MKVEPALIKPGPTAAVPLTFTVTGTNFGAAAGDATRVVTIGRGRTTCVQSVPPTLHLVCFCLL